MHRMGWTARLSAALGLAAVTLASAPRPASAAIACAGPVVATGHLGPLALPAGSARPSAPLVTDAGRGPAGVVLDGVILPASAGSGDRTALAAAVVELAAGPIAVHAERLRKDRRGRVAGAIETADGRDLQVELLSRGLVVADGEETPCGRERAAAERAAREAGRGLWAAGRLPRPADEAAADLPDFLIATGTVLSVGKRGRTTYLNFGRRYAEDLTVRVSGPVAEGLAGRGLAVESLAGRRVTVRGWAEPRNGVDVALASPAALEIDEGSRAR